MTLRLFLPADAAAQSVGAEAVARAVAGEAARRGRTVELVRTGSRGLLWLEPLLEAEGPGGRIGFGNVRAADVAGLFEAGFPETGHKLALGRMEALPWLARQTRLVFARVGMTDPLSLEAYRAHDGLGGLEAALGLAPEEIVARVAASGLRGRGGAGFPTGIKWRTVLGAAGGAEIRRVQRRRGRQRHLRGPDADRGRSLRADRGDGDRGAGGGGDEGVRLSAVGISAGRGGAAAGAGGGAG